MRVPRQPSLPLAFWFDAVTYLASAVLLATIVVPPIVRRTRAAVDAWGEPLEGAEREPEGPPTVADIRAISRRAGHFLRPRRTLLANTLQGTAAQFAVGV